MRFPAIIAVATAASAVCTAASALDNTQMENCGEVIGARVSVAQYLDRCGDAFPEMAASFYKTKIEYGERNAAAYKAALGEALDLARLENPAITAEQFLASALPGLTSGVNRIWREAADKRNFCLSEQLSVDRGVGDIKTRAAAQFRACVGFLRSLMF